MTVNPLNVFSWTSPDVIDGSDTHAWWKKTSVRQYYEKSIANSYMADEAGAIDIGTIYADNVKSMLDKATSAGSNDTMYSIYLHGIGDRDNQKGLLHDDDVLTGWVDGSTLLGNGGPYSENGRAEAKTWVTAFLDAFKTQIDILGYPHPQRFHLDLEINIEDSLSSRPPSSGYVGWMDAAYNDARATTELVDGINTFKSLVDNWTTIDGLSFSDGNTGGTPFWEAAESYWGESNLHLRHFMSYLNSLIRNYFLYDVVMIHAKSIFPSTTWSNYKDFNAGTWENPTTTRTKASSRFIGHRADRADFSSPVLYPMRNTAFQDPLSSKADWITTLGVESRMLLSGPPYEKFDYETIWTTANELYIKGIVAEDGADRVVPWIMYEGWTPEFQTNFIDDVDLAIIDSADAANFLVGNKISLQNSSNVELYQGDIVRIVDLENGTHQINVDLITPSDGEINFGSVSKAVDAVILASTAVSSFASEPSGFFYNTEQSGILKVLESCIEQGVTEYLFWQHPGLIDEDGWNFNSEAIAYLEDGLGVLLGQASAIISGFGNTIEFFFDKPANGDWESSEIVIDDLKAATITADGNIVTFADPIPANLGVTGEGKLSFFLNITSGFIGAGQEVVASLTKGWLTQPGPEFESAATANVSTGIMANPTKGFITATNDSVITLLLDSSNPSDDATEVSLTPDIEFIFNKNVTPLVSGLMRLRRVSDGLILESINGGELVTNINNRAKVTWRTSITLDSNESYYIDTVGGIIIAQSDGELWPGLSGTTAFNFTTALTTIPTLSSTIPVNNATRIALPIVSTTGSDDLNVDYVLNFNIDVVGNSGSIRIFDSTGEVDSAAYNDPEITISGSTVTWTNPSNMNPNTNYYILADSGFVESALDASDWVGISNVNEFTFKTYSSVPNAIQNTPKDPMYDIGMFSGTGGNGINPDNPNGHANWWNVNPNRIASDYDRLDSNTGLFLFAETVESAMRNLQERIQYGYDQGARSFFLNRPMGSNGTSHVSAASWETIEVNKRTQMAATLKQISQGRLGENVKINIFIGSGMYAGDDLRGWTGPNSGGGGFLLGDNSTAERKATSDIVLNGWINDADVSGIIIDHASPENEREHFAGLGIDLWQEFGVYLLIEALPRDIDPDGPYTREADMDHINRVGAVGTTAYFDNNNFLTRPDLNINFSHNFNRIFVWYQNSASDTEQEKIDEYNYYTGLGRFTIARDPTVFALALADFNNDFGLNYSLIKSFDIGESSTNDPLDVTFFFNKTESLTHMRIDERLDEGNPYPSSVRIVAPDGETVYWSVRPRDSERFTVAGTDPVISGDKLEHTVLLPIEKDGIYKIVVKSFEGEQFDIYSTIDIDEWGIFCPSGSLNENVFDLDTGYVFVPGEAPTYYFDITGTVAVTDAALNAISADSESANPTFGADDVWVVSVTAPWSIEHYATPFVVCNSIAAANSIQSGTVLTIGINGLDDQRFYSVGDQILHARIVDIIDTLESTDHTTVVKSFDLAETLWPENTLKYDVVRQYPNMFKTIHTNLKRQNLDVTSYRAGYMNPSTGPDSGMNIWGDNISSSGQSFGFLYAWNDDGNPYYNDSEIGKRAKIAMLGELRGVQGYRVRKSYNNSSSRLGSVGLESKSLLGSALFFNDEANNISIEDIDAIMPSLLDQLDRTFADYYTTTRNQDCLNLETIVMASKLWKIKYGNDKLEDLCIQEAKNITTTINNVANVALPEAIAYDGSYSGIQNFAMSSGYICGNKDEKWGFIKDSIEQNYNYWSQFLCPSSTGMGTFGYDNDSRTTLGSLFEQFTGAQRTLPDDIPIVARWTKLSGKYDNATNSSASQGLSDYMANVNERITNDTDDEDLFDLAGSSKFQIFPLWTDAMSNLPEDVNLPCEIRVDEVSVVQKDHVIEIQTPWYYASISTFQAGNFYWQFALEQYETPRAFDSVGGIWNDENYPMTTIDDRRGLDGEELGGCGLSMLYSKEANRPVITGRNINPFTTHQIVGVTGSGELRWGWPTGRTYSIDENKLTIEYSLYGDDYLTESDYSIVRTFTFSARNIVVENSVTKNTNSVEDMVELYESIPLCVNKNVIGGGNKDTIVAAISAPSTSIHSLGNGISIHGDLIATPFVEYTTTNDRESVSYARIPISIPGLGQTTTMSYNIEMPFDEEESVDIRDGDYGDVPAIISPALPRNRNRAGAIRNSSLFFKVNNRTFPLQGAGSPNRRVNNIIPQFRNRAVVQLDYLFDVENSFSEIRYTVNGDIPNKKSTLYNKPIELNRSISNGEIVSLKARVFDKESIVAGKVLEFQFKIV